MVKRLTKLLLGIKHAIGVQMASVFSSSELSNGISSDPATQYWTPSLLSLG